MAALVTISCRFQLDRALSPGQIRGQVVIQPSPGAPTTPVSGAIIAMEDSSIAVRSDDRGMFVIGGLPPSTYTLDVTALQSGSLLGLRLSNLALQPSAVAPEPALDLGEIPVSAAGGISGTVTVGGTAVTGAVVAMPGFGTTRTQAGAYAFSNCLPGDFSLGAVYATVGESLVAPAEPVKVRSRQVTAVPPIDLNPTASAATTGGIQGQVLLQGGVGAVRITVQLAGTATSLKTDDNGNYQATNVASGVYTLAASAPGYLTAVVPAIIVGGTALTIVPTITLGQVSNNISGTGPDGGPPQQLAQLGNQASHSANFAAVTSTSGPAPLEQSSHYFFFPTGLVRVASPAENSP
jgi:hypothetical protein